MSFKLRKCKALIFIFIPNVNISLMILYVPSQLNHVPMYVLETKTHYKDCID